MELIAAAAITGLFAVVVALLNRGQNKKLDQINNAVNHRQEGEPTLISLAAEMHQSVGRMEDKVAEVSTSQTVTLAVLDRLIGLRAMDREQVASLARLVESGARKDRSDAVLDRSENVAAVEAADATERSRT
jgi:hypothetical protein